MTDRTAMTAPRPQILPHGPDGLVLRLGLTADPATLAAVQALRAAIEAAAPEGVEEIAGSLTSVLLRFDPARIARAELAARVTDIATGVDLARATLPPPARRWTIPVAFGGDEGPQFDAMAHAAGLTPEAALRELLDTPLRVLTIGFAPGFPYIGLLPPAWDVPRLPELTPRVPRGALCAAVRQLVLFTTPSPTGWRWIGRSAFAGFDMSRDPAVLLAAGDEIRLARVPGCDLAALERDNPDGRGGARLERLA